jgi:hypothetical protein
MARGWAISPMIGSGTSDDPFRPQLADRPATDGDRLEFVVGNENRGIVAYDVASTANFGANGGTILFTAADLLGTFADLSNAQRTRINTLADDWGIQRPVASTPVKTVLRVIGRRLLATFDEDVHLGSSPPPPTGSFVVDSFTDTATTDLASHTGETGATWTNRQGTCVISDANRVRSSVGSAYYTASGSPTSFEYDLVAVVRCVTDNNDSRCGPMGRSDGADIATADFYWARMDVVSSDGVALLKFVAGAATSLGAYAFTLSNATDYTVLLSIRDGAKRVYIDNVERISSADNAVDGSLGNLVGVRFDRSSSDTTALHIDSFSATDPAAAPSLYVNASPLRW